MCIRDSINAAYDVVRRLKTFSVKLKVHGIEESKLRNILIADSSFDTPGQEKSQHGWLLGYTTDCMNKGVPTPLAKQTAEEESDALLVV